MHRSRCVRKPCMCKAYNHPIERRSCDGVKRMKLTLLFGERPGILEYRSHRSLEEVSMNECAVNA